MATITIRYWAAARSAAGTDTEQVEATSCQAALDRVLGERAPDPTLARVMAVSSFLVDGVARRRRDLAQPESGLIVLEVLPPFAGG